MSKIMFKTINALPNIIGGSSTSVKEGTNSFQTFVKSLGNVHTKHDEKQLVLEELNYQKKKLADPATTLFQKRESLMRLIYCHVLGYDVQFAFIHSVKLAQQGTLLEKRIGYLACSIFLHEDHELVVLLVNTIQKDLSSSNALEVCFALNAASQLISADMIPSLLPIVQEKVNHSKETVRRKAVLVLHSFLLKAPAMVQHLQPVFRKALCDKQPTVVWASLHIYTELAKSDPQPYRELVPSLLEILHQIQNRQLPEEYVHHNVVAPWFTICLLKLLALLAHGHQETSALCYPAMHEVLQKTEISHKAGLAVIYECLLSIASLHPHPKLLELAANCVSRFLKAKSINYKYLGLKALIALVKESPEHVADHQEVVVDCLEHEDAVIRAKTLELLFHMANSSNVGIVCEKLMHHLSTLEEDSSRRKLVENISKLANRFSAKRSWYLETVNGLMLTSQTCLPKNFYQDVIQNLSEMESEEDKLCAVNCYWQLLHSTSNKLPDDVLLVAVWVLSSFGPVAASPDLSQIAKVLLHYYKHACTRVQVAILEAFQKLIFLLDAGSKVVEHLKAGVTSPTGQVRQKLRELSAICKMTASQREALKAPSNEHPLDLSLTFLDDYVSDQLEKGGKLYTRADQHPETGALVNTLPAMFASDVHITSESYPSLGAASSDRASSVQSGQSSSDATMKESVSLNVKGVKQVWGPGGRMKTNKVQPSVLQTQESAAPPPKDVRKSQLAASLFEGVPQKQKHNQDFSQSTSINIDSQSLTTNNHHLQTDNLDEFSFNKSSNQSKMLEERNDSESYVENIQEISHPGAIEKKSHHRSNMPASMYGDNLASSESEPASMYYSGLQYQDLTLDLSEATQQSLLEADLLKSPEFYGNDSKSPSEIGSGDGSFVKIKHEKQVEEFSEILDSFHSSPTKSLRSDSIDTDSIEEL